MKDNQKDRDLIAKLFFEEMMGSTNMNEWLGLAKLLKTQYDAYITVGFESNVAMELIKASLQVMMAGAVSTASNKKKEE